MDEDYVSLATACGVGACAVDRRTSCASGSVVDSCAPGAPAADDSLCNGIDDDCSGAVDEDYVPLATACGVGACAATGSTSCARGRSSTPAAGTPAADDSACNGIDDDCSGAVDEDYVSLPTACGVGACAATGSTSCASVVGRRLLRCRELRPPMTRSATASTMTAAARWTRTTSPCRRPAVSGLRCDGQHLLRSGSVVDSCVPGAPAADDSLCNGIDDDCSGAVDEDYVPLATACGVGACAATGITSCVGASVVDSCAPGAPAAVTRPATASTRTATAWPTRTTCPLPTTCGVGACAVRRYYLVCVNGAVQPTPALPDAPAAMTTLCNGIDDDCDGAVGRRLRGPADHLRRRRLRSRPVSTSCASARCRTIALPGSPAADDSLCNGIDDDCDGAVDEDYVSLPTTCGVGSLALDRQTSCSGGQMADSCTAGQPTGTDENCNGLDEDCDGAVDNHYTPSVTSCGQGVCIAAGQLICVNGATHDTCTAGQPTGADANCNGLDEDCDGARTTTTRPLRPRVARVCARRLAASSA